MADVFDSEQAGRLFGVIAAGGSLGALIGPALTGLLVGQIGVRGMLIVSMSLLALAIVCIHKLLRWRDRNPGQASIGLTSGRAIGGSIWAGVTRVANSRYLQLLAVLTALGTFSASLLYYQQAFIVREAIPDPVDQTRYFALIDWLSNSGTILIEVFLVSRLLRWLDVARTIAIPAVIGVVALLILGLAPPMIGANLIWLVAPVMVIRRATAFGILSPVGNMLYTVVDAESKYKAKHFIDTAVYRLGDFASGWTFKGLTFLGFGLSPIALIGAGVGVAWTAVAVTLGLRFERRRDREKPVG